MECWYSADSWEKKTKQKTKQIIKNENQTLSFRCRRTAVVFDTKVIELSFPPKIKGDLDPEKGSKTLFPLTLQTVITIIPPVSVYHLG